MPHKRTLLLDFDGVIHSYKGWDGDEPKGDILPGARRGILDLARHYRVVVFTARKPEFVQPWLQRHGLGHLPITHEKVPAFLQVDDRVLPFNGEWSDELLKNIHNFKPWWKEPAEEGGSVTPPSP